MKFVLIRAIRVNFLSPEFIGISSVPLFLGGYFQSAFGVFSRKKFGCEKC
jgi:hypothetical protein